MPLYNELAYDHFTRVDSTQKRLQKKSLDASHLMLPLITKNGFVVLQCLTTCKSDPCELPTLEVGIVATPVFAPESFEAAPIHCLTIARDEDFAVKVIRLPLIIFRHCNGMTQGSQE